MQPALNSVAYGGRAWCCVHFLCDVEEKCVGLLKFVMERSWTYDCLVLAFLLKTLLWPVFLGVPRGEAGGGDRSDSGDSESSRLVRLLGCRTVLVAGAAAGIW